MNCGAAHRTPELTEINNSTNIFGSTSSHSLPNQVFCQTAEREGELLRLSTEDCTHPYSPWQMGKSRENKKENSDKYKQH